MRKAMEKDIYYWITNIYFHLKPSKCSLMVAVICKEETLEGVPICISLNKLNFYKMAFESTTSSFNDIYSEGIAVYNRFYFCGGTEGLSRYKYSILQTNHLKTIELTFNTTTNLWKTTAKQSMKPISEFSLTSIYSNIYAIGGSILEAYSIALNQWKVGVGLNSNRYFPCVFAINCRYIYAIGGMQSTKSANSFTEGFEVIDVLSSIPLWKEHKLSLRQSIYKCKCIQLDSKSVLILGGQSKTVLKLEVLSLVDIKISVFAQLPYWDSLEGNMCPVYWNGSYYLGSGGGILYKYSTSSHKISTNKTWAKKYLHIDAKCYGG